MEKKCPFGREIGAFVRLIAFGPAEIDIEMGNWNRVIPVNLI